MKLNILLLSVFCFFILACQVKKKVGPINLKEDTNELKSSNEIDFDLIKEWVKGKKIVSIGESTHGIGEYFELKSEIVQYLHKELRYEVIAIEGSFADIHLAWDDIDNLDFLELRNSTLYGNFKCQEIEPLFKYLKENSKSEKPLLYAGYDPQIAGNYYEDCLDLICHHLKLDIDVETEFTAYSKMYQASREPDSTNFIKYRDGYKNVLTTIREAIAVNRTTLQEKMKLSHLKLDVILRSLDMQYVAVDYSYANMLNSEYMPRAIIIRDETMAENIKWMIDNMYPDKKIIIWGFNGHIQKGKSNNMSTKMMGQHLKEFYGDDYFSIGLFAYKGKAYQHWTQKSIEFENSDSTAIENIMKRDAYQYSFQRFDNTDPQNWTNNELTGYEIESMGKVSFVPSERFEAGICIYNADIPTFEKRN
jgi:erythromycin esterase